MWKDLISNTPDGPMVLDVVEWLDRAALDVCVQLTPRSSTVRLPLWQNREG